MTEAFLSLGSNLGDRKKNLAQSRERLSSVSGISLKKMSRVIETDPVDFIEQPAFMNQVVFIETDLSPDILLEKILSIENDMGRVRKINKGPRIIDIDILLYGGLCVDIDGLTIPHPELLNRNFFIELILEIDAEAVHPAAGRKISEVFI